jgi:antitoxin StbD
MLDRLEDIELNALAESRKDQPEVSVNLDEL